MLAASVKHTHAFDASKVIEGDASSNKVFRFFRSFNKQGKKEEALSVLKYAAQNGNSAAQWKLGRMYQTGDGVPQNSLEAFNFYRRLADRYQEVHPRSPDWQFRANAFVALGHYYQTGIPEGGIVADWSKARVMYTTAAMVFGHPDGQFELGRMELKRARNSSTSRRAVKMLRRAHRKGHIGAQALLGHALFEGEHVNRDAVRGLAMLTQATQNAPNVHRQWISALQEDAFSVATEEERRLAIALIEVQQ